MDWGWAQANAQDCRPAISKPDGAGATPDALSNRLRLPLPFQRRDRQSTSSNAEIACWTVAICINSQPFDRSTAVLQRDDQIPTLLLELNERQTVIRQMSRHDGPGPLSCALARSVGQNAAIAGQVCHPFTKLLQILANGTGDGRPDDRLAQRMRDAVGGPLAGMKLFLTIVGQLLQRNAIVIPAPHQGKAAKYIDLRIGIVADGRDQRLPYPRRMAAWRPWKARPCRPSPVVYCRSINTTSMGKPASQFSPTAIAVATSGR